MNLDMPQRAGTYHLVAAAAHALIYDRSGRLLAIRRNGSGYLDGYWSVPAGHVEREETALRACAREVKEEVGLEFAESDFQFALVQQKSGSDGEERIDFFFEVTWDGSQRPVARATYELDAVAWVEPSELPSPFAPYVLTAIGAIREGARLSTWGLE